MRRVLSSSGCGSPALFAALLMLSPTALAQGVSEPATAQGLGHLAEALRAASPDGPFLVRLDAPRCTRVIGAIRRGQVVYFRVASGSETSEFDALTGQVTLRQTLRVVQELLPGAAAVLQQCSAPPLRFRVDRITRAGGTSGAVTWDGPISTFCLEMRMAADCSFDCQRFSDAGARLIAFANTREAAAGLLAAVGREAPCLD